MKGERVGRRLAGGGGPPRAVCRPTDGLRIERNDFRHQWEGASRSTKYAVPPTPGSRTRPGRYYDRPRGSGFGALGATVIKPRASLRARGAGGGVRGRGLADSSAPEWRSVYNN